MGRLHPTDISWCDMAVNPIVAIDRETGKRGWACTKIAQGCNHCYAETLNVGRFGNGHRYDVKGNAAVEWKFDENAITSVLSRRKPATIFWCDMTDMFHENVPDAWLDRMFAAMALTPHLHHIVLTKRATRMRGYMADDELRARLATICLVGWKRGSPGFNDFAEIVGETIDDDDAVKNGLWPLPNVALGVSVATQKDADELVPELLATPAALRFVSYEPAIEAVRWTQIAPSKNSALDVLAGVEYGVDDIGGAWDSSGAPGAHLDAIIIGGESGAKARPFDLAWADSTIEQCEAAGVVALLKQYGRSAWFFDGWSQNLRWATDDSHGGNPSEWAERHLPYACSPEKWPWPVAVPA